MAARRYTQFSQRRLTHGTPPDTRKGVAAERRMPMKASGYPTPGPAGKSGFNRTTKTPVLKAYVAKHGLC